MDRAQRIETILREALSPTTLSVRDDSGKHAGHAGARPGGQTHYHVVIVSAAFAGLSRVAMHQKIYALLGAEFDDGLHALSIDARAP